MKRTITLELEETVYERVEQQAQHQGKDLVQYATELLAAQSGVVLPRPKSLRNLVDQIHEQNPVKVPENQDDKEVYRMSRLTHLA